MMDREKVIGGLEHCANGICNECPYIYECWTTECNPAARDALALLKEQEPRVMTLEEALGGDECWVEYPNGGCGYADCYMSYTTNGADIYRTMQHDFNVPLDTYGKSWRCWTSRPTDAQREKVKWDD